MLNGGMLNGGAANGRTVHDGTGLRAGTLALLLEPLGVDAVAGPAALQRFAEDVAALARARGCPALPPTGSTLPPVSDAVAACAEAHELIRLTTARGGIPAPHGDAHLGELRRLDGLRGRLPALEGVPVEALRADAAAQAVAERELPGALEPCRRAEREWPEGVWPSIRDVDVESATAELSLPRGSRRAARARELVLGHGAATLRELRNRELVPLLEKVRDLVVAEEAYETLLSGRPRWWRWLAPDTRTGFDAERCDALRWAIEARDTGAVSASALDMLADADVRAVLGRGSAAASASRAADPSAPASGSAAPGSGGAAPASASTVRITEGLLASASRTGIDELRAFESWYTKNLASFDRVAAAMDLWRTEPALREALAPLVARLASSPGAVDPSRPAYRDLQAALRVGAGAEAGGASSPTPYSPHAVDNRRLVEVMRRLGALERTLRDAVRFMPAAGGRLTVAVAGRTKSGKTTLRKALIRDADRDGIGRGAHRTTRETAAFRVGSVTYLDTPGVAAKDDDHDATRARAACDDADAVIWNYADTLRDEESAELLRLLRSGKPLLIVVNVKSRVVEPHRLRRFADDPAREFEQVAGHTARIEQVCRAAGAAPPAVLPVHSGAAHEALSTPDRELGDRALRASRLPELEQSLTRLLAERALPLRAVRLADGVRAPVAAAHDRLARELRGIGLALDALERATDDDRTAVLTALRTAGRDTRDRLEAARHRASKRLPDVVGGLGGADAARTWSDFLTGLEVDELLSGLSDACEREALNRGVLLRTAADAPEHTGTARPRVRPRPDLRTQTATLGTGAAKGAATALLKSVVAKGVPKSALPPPATVVVHAAGALAGAAKAVSGEILRIRRAQDRWADASATEAAARLDVLFDELTAWSDRFTEAVTDQTEARFEAWSADIVTARERCERLARLRPVLRSALDGIDLVLARRLLDLAGGDPAAVRRACRTPGAELRLWTDPSRTDDVRARLRDRCVDVLTERIEIRPDPTDEKGEVPHGDRDERNEGPHDD
ncbi:GTPase [Streptomyces sp. NPDC016675]|uniref:GTPase n=1 Tax=Streptomyces sp. NPDC016675 TaxID=3364970 RepID=UPI0036F93F0B